MKDVLHEHRTSYNTSFIMITFFVIGMQTVKFGLKTIYNSTASNEYK